MNKKPTKARRESDLGTDLCNIGKIESAIPHLRYAASKGDITAIVNLGQALKRLGQYDEGFKWTLKGAEIGNTIAMYNLAIMYSCGQGTPCNVEEAIKWANKLIEAGEIDKGYESLFIAHYCASDPSQKDEKKAFEIAKEGADIIMKNNPMPNRGVEAKTAMHVGICLEAGQGVKKDEGAALKYLRYAGECGVGQACNNAGCILLHPENRKMKDASEAIVWFTKGTQVGYDDCWYQLGLMFEKGKDMPKNINKAKMFYCFALRNGNCAQHYEDAYKQLYDLNPKLAERAIRGQFISLIDR